MRIEQMRIIFMAKNLRWNASNLEPHLEMKYKEDVRDLGLDAKACKNEPQAALINNKVNAPDFNRWLETNFQRHCLAPQVKTKRFEI